MAKIEIERKPRRSLVPLLLALLVIAAVAVGVYYYLERQRAAAPAPADTSPVTPGSMNREAPRSPELPAAPGDETLVALRVAAEPGGA